MVKPVRDTTMAYSLHENCKGKDIHEFTAFLDKGEALQNINSRFIYNELELNHIDKDITTNTGNILIISLS